MDDRMEVNVVNICKLCVVDVLMCVCICVCTYVCMYLCVSVFMCVCMRVYLHVDGYDDCLAW